MVGLNFQKIKMKIFLSIIGGLGSGSIVNVTFNLSKIESSVFTTKNKCQFHKGNPRTLCQ